MQRRCDRAYTRLHPPPKQSSTSEPLEQRVDRSNRARPRRACSRLIVHASLVRRIAGVAFSESACVQARSKKKQHRCSCALVMVPKSERTRANCVHVKYCQCMPLRLGNVSLTMHAEAAGMALRVVNTPGLRLASKSAAPQSTCLSLTCYKSFPADSRRYRGCDYGTCTSGLDSRFEAVMIEDGPHGQLN